MLLPYIQSTIHYPKAKSEKPLVSLHALQYVIYQKNNYADEIVKSQYTLNWFLVANLQSFQIRNNELVPGSQFSVPD